MELKQPSLQEIRYGKNESLPEQQVLKAGPLTAILEDGTLRYIRIGEDEAVRQIYVAVRDRNWGTVLPKFVEYDVQKHPDHFLVSLKAETRSSEVDFLWEGKITGTADGVIEYTMKGTAQADFLRNRIGFCILHPMELAGKPLQVDTAEGTIQGVFPERIFPRQPFYNIKSLRHPVENAEVEIQFRGDLFEMEDQRNWTDASYKTYCTPLGNPFPVQIKKGQIIEQTVTVTAHSRIANVSSDPTVTPLPASSNLKIQVYNQVVGRLPAIGLAQPQEGDEASKHITDIAAKQLRDLNLSHIWTEINLMSDHWKTQLLEAAQTATKVGDKSLALGIVCGNNGEGLREFVMELKHSSFPVARIHVFRQSDNITTRIILQKIRALLNQFELAIPVGGGTRAYYTELNRAVDLPLEQMNFAGYTINPQVHAFDLTSVVETLPMQALTVENASRITTLPLHIGPVTLKPRFQPTATGSTVKPRPGELPFHVDKRQPSLFCAGWTAGSLQQLAKPTVHSLTYHTTDGLRGVLNSKQGMVYPVYHVLADAAEYSGSEILDVKLQSPLESTALALKKGSKLRILVASFVNEKRTFHLDVPWFALARVRYLDETTAVQAMTDVHSFRGQFTGLDTVQEQPTFKLELLPFAIACVDLRLD